MLIIRSLEIFEILGHLLVLTAGARSLYQRLLIMLYSQSTQQLAMMEFSILSLFMIIVYLRICYQADLRSFALHSKTL
jgi:hypothetical protein